MVDRFTTDMETITKEWYLKLLSNLYDKINLCAGVRKASFICYFVTTIPQKSVQRVSRIKDI